MMLLTNPITFQKPLKGVQVTFWGSAYTTITKAKDQESKAFQKGFEQAKNQHIQELEALKQSQAELFKNIEAQFQELIQSINERIPSLVVGVTEKVLGNIEPLEENIIGIVNEAIQEAPQESRLLKVLLSEEDHQRIQDNLGQIQSNGSQLQFIANNSLRSGDCLIESDFGVIDAKASTKLKKIENTLNGQ